MLLNHLKIPHLSLLLVALFLFSTYIIRSSFLFSIIKQKFKILLISSLFFFSHNKRLATEESFHLQQKLQEINRIYYKLINVVAAGFTKINIIYHLLFNNLIFLLFFFLLGLYICNIGEGFDNCVHVSIY